MISKRFKDLTQQDVQNIETYHLNGCTALDINAFSGLPVETIEDYLKRNYPPVKYKPFMTRKVK